MRILSTVIALTVMLNATIAAEKRPMTIDDLYQFKRVDSPSISPDGKQVVYQVGSVDFDKNKTFNTLMIVPTDGSTEPKALLQTPEGKSDHSPRFAPDGKNILFISNRSDTSQLWIVAVDGKEPKQLTTISTGVEIAIWAPDSKSIAFVSTVYPEFSELPFVESDAKNKAKMDAIEKNPVKAKVFTKLFYRHWDHYVEDKRQHIFVTTIEGAEPKDATPGDRDAVPTSSTFSSGEDYTFSPDSKHLLFTAVPATNEAWSTNYDICRVSIDEPTTDWETLTKNEAADSGPRFSPDGKRLAYRAQAKPGYEADRWDVLIFNCTAEGMPQGEPTHLFPTEDLSVGEFAWYGHSDIIVSVEMNGYSKLMDVSADGSEGRRMLTIDGRNGSVSVDAQGKQFAFNNSMMTRPNEVFAGKFIGKGGIVQNISMANDTLLSQLDLPKPESVKVPVEDTQMQMWILKPPGFDDSKKWPVVYLVHGGPQGAWDDGWSFRWNPELWAAQGYVIVMPNPRGSTGFGQKFTDEISGDWGGKCYRDLVAGIEYVEKLPYVDSKRIATAGASFGGYMQNWFAVNDIKTKFACQVNHCSVYNFESMWGTTDELWFDEYEHGGLPWEKPGQYAEFSPHKLAGNIDKDNPPMLIIHNDLDFRCPIGQGLELFQTLQRKGVPSRFINFPDEGHWVLKPQNSKYWHQEVFAWLEKYAPSGGK